MKNLGQNLRRLLVENVVTILFVVMCLVGIYYAQQPLSYILNEITTRLIRNLLLTLSLLVPVWAGLGLNFSIVLGAMAAQIGLIIVANFGISGVGNLALSFLISIPFSILFGYLTGRLFNSTKGQEMITGMVTGFFAKGLYDLVFMFLCGPVIPIRNKSLLLSNNIGLITPIVLDGKTNGSLNNLWKVSMDVFLNWVLPLLVGVLAVLMLVKAIRGHKKPTAREIVRLVAAIIVMGLYFYLCKTNTTFAFALMFTDIPVATVLVIVWMCLFLSYLGKTKLGSDFNAVGQSRVIADSMGIGVDHVRIVAVIISTILAALGQIVFIQDIGNFATYTAHNNVGTFAIAALMVGGASINKATIGQVILGTLLFHTIFMVAPLAGKNLFGDAQIGEYFRTFASYIVIAIALALHAWKTVRAARMSGKGKA